MKYEHTKYPGIFKYQTKSGIKYRVRHYYDHNGKKEEVSKSGFKTLNEARAFLTNIESKFDTGREGLVYGQKRTLAVAWEDYSTAKISSGKWNLQTQETNLSRIQPWLDKFADIPMAEITRNDIQNHIRKLYKENDYSQETMKGFFKVFMQVINDQVDEGFLSRNPFKKVSYEKDSSWRPKTKAVDFDTFHTFMKVAKKEMRPDMYRCLYIATFGLRRGEVYGIKQSSIRFLETGYAAIDISCARTSKYPEGKDVKSSDSNRIVVVDETARAMLKRQIEEAGKIKEKFGQILHQDDFIFITPSSGRPYYIKALNDAMAEINKQIKANTPITPHVLRHTFASYASASGVDSLQLRKYIGHADLDMTNHYTHSTIKGATEVMLKTADYRIGKLSES